MAKQLDVLGFLVDGQHAEDAPDKLKWRPVRSLPCSHRKTTSPAHCKSSRNIKHLDVHKGLVHGW